MTLQDVIRERTFLLRDALTHAEQQARDAQSRRDAAEQQMKRATTEITRQRTLENERKRVFNSTSEEVADAQRRLDEIERQRAEALDLLLRIQEQERQLDKELREARHLTEVAVSQVNNERKSIQEADTFLARFRDDANKRRAALSTEILNALDLFIYEQAQRVLNAFTGQEERDKVLQQLEEFKKARHQDRQIGDLCDQRDELRKMINTAMVPAVKKVLQDAIAKIESELDKRYPGVLSIQETPPRETMIEELHYYSDKNDKCIFMLPIAPDIWETIPKDANSQVTRAMRVLWSMIKEFELTPTEGAFAMHRACPVFKSTLDADVAALLQGFAVRTSDAPILQFVLSALPPEVQEGLIDED